MIKNIFDAIPEHVPAGLQPQVIASLDAPQQGPYHHECPTLRSHLELMFTVLAAVRNGIFHEKVPQEIRDWMQEMAETHEKLFIKLVFLHKSVALNHLSGRADIHPVVVSVIGMQDVVSQITNRIDIPLFETLFDRPVYNRDMDEYVCHESLFHLVFSYVDQMSSLDADGKPNVDHFVWLANTYLAACKFADLSERLKDESGMHWVALQGQIETLRVSRDAFQSETVDEAYARIAAACAV